MNIIKEIKKELENKKTFSEMKNMVKDYKKNKKKLNKTDDDNKKLEIKSQMLKIKNDLKQKESTYIYKYRSINKQKKIKVKQYKTELEDLYLEKEMMENSLNKYKKENSEFSKDKYNKIWKKYKFLLKDIMNIEKLKRIIEGTEIDIKSNNNEVDEVINDLEKQKTKIEDQIKIKDISLNECKKRNCEGDLTSRLNKDRERLLKQLEEVKQLIEIMEDDNNEKNKDN